MAGFAIRSRFAGHARRSAQTRHALRLKLDHSIGAGQRAPRPSPAAGVSEGDSARRATSAPPIRDPKQESREMSRDEPPHAQANMRRKKLCRLSHTAAGTASAPIANPFGSCSRQDHPHSTKKERPMQKSPSTKIRDMSQDQPIRTPLSSVRIPHISWETNPAVGPIDVVLLAAFAARYTHVLNGPVLQVGSWRAKVWKV